LKGPIQSVEVTYLIHATEDPRKVEAAVVEVLGVESKPETEGLEGHFGNLITKVRVHLTGEAAATAFRALVARMPQSLRRGISEDIDSLIDEHSALFLRFDKQLQIRGTLSLASGDAVRVKVKPRGFMVKGGAVQFFSQLIGGA